MTVELADRIEMADSDELSLDVLFERLERMPVPEGYKVEIVEGDIHMSLQRDAHWDLILAVTEQLRVKYPRQRLKSDVRFDFPGHLNGFAPDLVALCEGAEKDAKGLWRYADIEFVLEVVSKGTGANDYGPKKRVYAGTEVPVYLIVDPYQGKCHAFTHPKKDDYVSELTVEFGEDIDLAGTAVRLVLTTDDFPRD